MGIIAMQGLREILVGTVNTKASAIIGGQVFPGDALFMLCGKTLRNPEKSLPKSR